MNSRNVRYSFHILDHCMCMYSDKKFMHRLFTVLFLVKKQVENVIRHTSQDISFCNMHHCQILQGIIWSNYGHLAVTCTIGVEDTHLGTDMFSLRSVMNPVDHEDLLQVPLFGATLILMWCVITLAVIIQLHLWHLYLQVSALSVGDLHSQGP
jgi:hypothetical protein